MKLFVLFLMIGAACAMSHSFFTVPGAKKSGSSNSGRPSSSRSSGSSSSSGRSSSGRSSSGRSSSRPRPSGRTQSRSSPVAASTASGVDVHGTNGDSEYHYSWIPFRGRKFSASGAASYCKKLGKGWKGVSINSAQENTFIVGQVRAVEYIWTSGKKGSGGWRWADGKDFAFKDWSHTGGKGRPQPDNRDGNENCMSILNNFYKDGIHWHDVGCSHTKPTICERPKM